MRYRNIFDKLCTSLLLKTGSGNNFNLADSDCYRTNDEQNYLVVFNERGQREMEMQGCTKALGLPIDEPQLNATAKIIWKKQGSI